MRKSYNDSGLTAKRSYRLLTAGLTAILMAFTACASQAPLDDAYYYPDKKSAVVSSSTAQRESAESVPAAPTMEIVSQQDTTITVRIKR